MSPSQSDVFLIGPDGVPVGVVRRPPPPPSRIWLHVLLFVATLGTTTLFGAFQFADLPDEASTWTLAQIVLDPRFIVAGLAFSVPLLLILLTHELGHYLACRAHRLDATLPFFIPVPPFILGIGTLGAFIRIKTPLANKRELFDVGAAGPIAGFLVTIPILIAGVALSRPVAELPQTGIFIFGEPLAFGLLARLLHPEVAAGADLFLHPTGFAAWFGLLATALNLLPFGQLDGGHVTYAVFGRLQRRLSWPLLLVLVALGFRWMGWWLWVVIALVMGVRHPRLPDEDVSIDARRRALGWACIVIFALCFTPQPVRIVP